MGNEQTTKQDAKSRIFDLCRLAFEQEGPQFKLASVEMNAKGTNRQTLLKYVTQFRELAPLIAAMPESDYPMIEAIHALEQSTGRHKKITEDKFKPIIEELKQTIKQLGADKAGLNQALDESGKQHNKAHEQIEQQARDIDTLHEKFKGLEAKHAQALTIEATEREKVVAVLKQKHEHELALKDQNINQLQVDMAAQKQRSEHDMAAMEQQIAEGETNLQEIKKQLDDKNIDIIAIQRQSDALAAQLSSKDELITALQQEKSQLNEKLDTKNESLLATSLQLETLNNELANNVKTLEELRNSPPIPAFGDYLAQFTGDKSFKSILAEHKQTEDQKSDGLKTVQAQYLKMFFY